MRACMHTEGKPVETMFDVAQECLAPLPALLSADDPPDLISRKRLHARPRPMNSFTSAKLAHRGWLGPDKCTMYI